MIRVTIASLILVLATHCAFAQVPPEAASKLLDKVTPSLVAVQATWEYEYGKVNFVGPGVVVSDDGLVMLSIGVMNPMIPDSQLKDFKIIVPQPDKDDQELDAVFQGRDERAELCYVKAKDPRKWTAVKFEDVPIKVGEPVISIGMLPKNAGYKTYFQTGLVSTRLRGEVPSYLVTGGALAAVGAPVFDLDGKAIGFVNEQYGREILLDRSGMGGRTSRFGRSDEGDQEMEALGSIRVPPNIFTPASDFLFSLADPPTPQKPIQLSWMGLPANTGVNKDVAEVFGLKNQPAVEIGDVVPNSPADKAGLKTGMKIVKLNGLPLERGDEPEELPMILARKLIRMKVGQVVTLSVMTAPNTPLKDIQVTLGERPKRANQANRYYADDLGFSVRQMVWEDTYVRKLPADFKGLVVSLIKPQGPAANAKLEGNDVITQFNSEPVTSLDQFEKDYKAFRKDKPKEAIVLVVLKPDASNQTIRIEPPQQ